MTLPELLKQLARVENEKFAVDNVGGRLIFILREQWQVVQVEKISSDNCDAILRMIGRLAFPVPTVRGELDVLITDLPMLLVIKLQTTETEKLPATIEGMRYAVEKYLESIPIHYASSS